MHRDKNNITNFVYYICDMKLVIDNVKSEHFKWLTEMAKTLKFKVVEVQLSEDEEEQSLLMAMKDADDEPVLSKEEANEFETWLKSIK